MSNDLNHTPLESTSLANCIATMMDAYNKLIPILNFYN